MEMPVSLNADFIDQQYKKWKLDPSAVPSDWRQFFKGFEIGLAQAPDGDRLSIPETGGKQAGVEALIYRYRDLGHLLACMDPLSECPIEHPFLRLGEFGLSTDDLEKQFYAPGFTSQEHTSLKEIVRKLKNTYCRSIGVEYMHIQDPNERRWLQEKMESVENRPAYPNEVRRTISEKLLEAGLFERVLNTKYAGVTRFSLEGGEVIIPLLDHLVNHSSDLDVREIILGMAHRGRLNVQVNILKKPLWDIFAEFESCYDPGQMTGAGDVKYHNGYLADIQTRNGRNMKICLASNPSHLEAVDPVVVGMARARQEMIDPNNKEKVLPVLIHGDAAFAGQGILAETLGMSQLKGYTTAGTVHIIINNQIGFTTLPEEARSTRYSTDVAKMLMIPIFHLHGEDPEAAVHVAELATEYRNKFKKDVVLDVICYRKYGHNEGDEPYFTQPLMYERIKKRLPLYRSYANQLLEEGVMDQNGLETLEKELIENIEQEYGEVHGSACPFPEKIFYENTEQFHGKYSHQKVKTGISKKNLVDLAEKLRALPDGFSIHKKAARILDKRLVNVKNGTNIDWANAESLAFASILAEGLPVRLSGQDVGRGTFSQRHGVLVDTLTGDKYTPLENIGDSQGPVTIVNSPLSEAGVLGFEYGYSVIRPEGLTIWEAQFGDFVNNAQSMIDLFIVSGESKWNQLNGLVMLLPHGWEGLGPEHSSARLERFLQLCAEENCQVCYPTTPAQYFHLLRRQVKAGFRKPLIVMTPKSLLRLPAAVSKISDLTGGGFQSVIGDETKPESTRRILFCSGKIYYQLAASKDKKTSIVRIEQFYPFPGGELTRIVKKFKGVKQWVWVQEAPENMGAWWYLRPRLEKVTGSRLEYAGRPPASSPATGNPNVYKIEQTAIVDGLLK